VCVCVCVCVCVRVCACVCVCVHVHALCLYSGAHSMFANGVSSGWPTNLKAAEIIRRLPFLPDRSLNAGWRDLVHNVKYRLYVLCVLNKSIFNT